MLSKNILSFEAVCKIMGFDDNLMIVQEEMAQKLNVTFYPFEGKVSKETKEFYESFKKILEEYKVNIIPFEEALTDPRHKTIKRGICIIVLGEQEKENMAIERVTSLRDNLILTILDDPIDLSKREYNDQTEYGLQSLMWHFSNVIISVGAKYWVVSAGNGTSFHELNEDENQFKYNILNTVISKLAAPIRPIPLSEFTVKEKGFDAKSDEIGIYIEDMIKGSQAVEKTKLLEYSASLKDIDFKSESYRKLYSIMIDNRTGAHFGFLSRQLPTELSEILSIEDAEAQGIKFSNKDYTYFNDDIYVKYSVENHTFCLKVPEVATLTSISGSDKTNLRSEDILKMGIKGGKMWLQFSDEIDVEKKILPSGDEKVILRRSSNGEEITPRPSFDTKIIFTHAVASAIFASIMKKFKPHSLYPQIVEQNGLALLHWHGYVLPELIPRGWKIYGAKNPSFMCSTQQSGAVAFLKKELLMLNNIFFEKDEMLGEVHIEPQHGVNLSWTGLVEMAHFLQSSQLIAKVGNEYWEKTYNHSDI